MMRQYRSNEVFNPGAFPKYTYVSRTSGDSPYPYEFRLKQALNTSGFLTSIIGPSKTGKTVLCEKVIGIDKMIVFTGNDFKNPDDFWVIIAKKVGLSIEGEHTDTNSIEGEGIAHVKEAKSVSIREKYYTGKDKVIDYFKKNDLVLLLDDFHYAPEDVQYDIAYQLKDAIRKGFRAIVISLPHRADDAIRKNPDLSGRLNLINIEPWQEDALKEIAIKGFEKLGVEIADHLASSLAIESLTSPQLMQSICLNISFLLDLDENEEIDKLTDESKLEEAYKVVTINLPYKEVVKKIENGPPTRGQKRKKYAIDGGIEVDVYSLLIKAIALDPPLTSISLEEIQRRIYTLLIDQNDKLDRNKLKSAIEQTDTVIKTSGESIYQVLEWKDNELYILEPLFLFYLRWGNI